MNEPNTYKQKDNYIASKYNATKHGALSRLKILPWEDSSELEAIQENFLQDHQPLGATEKYLVLELANIVFRKQRIYQAENALVCKKLNRLSYWPGEMNREASILTKTENQYNNYDTLNNAIYSDIKEDKVELNWRHQIVQQVQKLINSDLSYEKMLKKLDSEIAELWQEYLKDAENNKEESFITSRENLITFLQKHVLEYNHSLCASIQTRPYIRQHALSSAYIPEEQNETLQRYETNLDRKFERTLATLLKLQNIRKESHFITVSQDHRA